MASKHFKNGLREQRQETWLGFCGGWGESFHAWYFSLVPKEEYWTFLSACPDVRKEKKYEEASKLSAAKHQKQNNQTNKSVTSLSQS